MEKNNKKSLYQIVTAPIPRFLIGFVFVISNLPKAEARNSEWPIQLSTGKEVIAVYQPKIESSVSDRVTARAAFSVKASGVPLKFGALRYQASVQPKGASGILFSDIVIEEIQYPGASTRRLDELKTTLQAEFGSRGFVLAKARFDADLRDLQTPNEGFDNAPPTIFYEESPAVLVFIDGEPVLKTVKDGNLKYVVNTAYFIVLNPEDNYYYLKGGKWWYRTKDLKKHWTAVSRIPKRVLLLAATAFQGDAKDDDNTVDRLTEAPKVIVSTTPAELIVLDGPPKMVPVEGTNLLYVDNTEDDILMDISSQQYYVLLAGRWYRSVQLNGGNWTYVSPEALPADFAKIPLRSSMADVLASVPGTAAADAAVLSNAIPEVAAIDRKTATSDVTYDGDPEFLRIEGTSVFYAVNADKTVLKIGDRYYLVDEGVWFDAPTPNGTWQVSTSVPEAVSEIPPSAPVYNVRYVYVYDYTPDVVYVGYTPGYYCSYVYDGTVVYGTGYYYRPWYRRYYFSRPITYGFGAHFHPFIGWWGFPVGVSYGWLSFGWFPFPFAYWGPAGYLYGYRHGYYHHQSHGYYRGYKNGYRHGYSAARTAGYRAAAHDTARRPRASANLYSHRKAVVERAGPLPTRRGYLAQSRATRLTTTGTHMQRPRQSRIGAMDRPRPTGPLTPRSHIDTVHRSPIERSRAAGATPRIRTAVPARQPATVQKPRVNTHTQTRSQPARRPSVSPVTAPKTRTYTPPPPKSRSNTERHVTPPKNIRTDSGNSRRKPSTSHIRTPARAPSYNRDSAPRKSAPAFRSSRKASGFSPPKTNGGNHPRGSRRIKKHD